jgi:hypothetical protein
VTFIDAQRDAINTLVYSATNPNQSPADTTDEVVDARGNKADLDTRISSVIDDDGALITPASLVSQAQLQSAIGIPQLLVNEDFLIWPVKTSAGTTAVPAFWNLTDGGSGSDTCAQEGTTKKYAYSVALTRIAGSTADTVLYQDILDAGAFITDLRTETFGFGCWVYSSIASHASIALNDGNDETETVHTGGGGWEWLDLTHTISGAGTYIRAELRVATNGVAYFCVPTVNFSAFAPDKWVASMRIVGTGAFDFRGAPAIADDVRRAAFNRPTLLMAVRATCANDPTGDVDIDIEKYKSDGGASWTSVFTAPKTILGSGNEVGSAVIDTATYEDKCLGSAWPAAGAQTTDTDTTIRLNLDAVNAVEDLTIILQGVQYCHPWEGHRAYNDLG